MKLHVRCLLLCTAVTIVNSVETTTTATTDDQPEGYYAFVESPHATPPRVRPPPYRQSMQDCPDLHSKKPHVSAFNLCGDLNKGMIPKNPMGQQNPFGEPYPFELIRNQTLKFLSRTLPILRADDTLPKVAQIQPTAEEAIDSFNHNEIGPQSERERRSLDPSRIPSSQLEMEHRGADMETPRESRKFCDGGGVFCMLYRAINGEGEPSGPIPGAERRDDAPPAGPANPNQPHSRYEGPPTPCPARVEYATPVFARNYQGVWRYVVQIPYEGYFTQTIEVTRCIQSRCYYLDGGCLSSPRWVSLLVAELHYPDAVLSAPNTHGPQTGPGPHNSQSSSPPPVHDFQNYQQYLQKRAGIGPDSDAGAQRARSQNCDGHDDLGCFQVRLYYDWFLVPGSCKCWRPDYFARYVRRKSSSPDL